MIEDSVDSPVEDYDLVVLGSGEGSKYLAWTLANQGQRVAVVEQRWIGGSCRTSPASPARTSFTARRSRRTSPEQRSSALQPPGIPSIWPR